MGRRRKAWLPGGTGKRTDSRTGRQLPGSYVLWWDYSGASRSLRSNHFIKQADARRWCREYNARHDLHLLGDATPVNVDAAAQEFAMALTTVRQSTRLEYATAIKRLRLHTDNAIITTIDGRTIDSLIAERMATTCEATAAKYLRHLRAFFNWCVKAGYATTNPVSQATVKPRHNIVRRKPRISDVQFRRLVAAIDTDHRRLAVQIAATTGMDRNVIATMTSSNVDLKARQFLIERAKTHRAVYPFIHEQLVAPLRRSLAQADPNRPFLSGLADRKWWGRAATEAGVADLKFVDLRTYAANWLRDILGDFEAQHILGHSTPAVTARHYYQANPEAQRRISRRPLPGT